MINFIRYIKEQSPWVVSRRFRLPIIASLLAAAVRAIPISWMPWLSFASLVVAVALLYDSVYLLPHEKWTVRRIKGHMDQLQLEKAKRLLARSRVMHGEPFVIKCSFLHAECCLQEEDFLGAYTTLRQTVKRYLLPTEATDYRCLMGRLYWEAGNLRDFIDLFRDDKSGFNPQSPSIAITLLKSHWHQAQGDLIRAKAVLNSGIARVNCRREEIPLYNNLAVLEGQSGNIEEKILHLFSAATALKETSLPRYFRSVYHNLAISLVRESRAEEARQVMRGYLGSIDRSNVQQCLDFCNDQLLFARETDDQKLIDQSHAFRQEYLSGKLTDQQEITLRIHELRMARNDQQPISDYIGYVRSLELDTDRLPENERLPALLEIASDIRFEFEKRLAAGSYNTDLTDLDECFMEVAGRAIALRDLVDKELQKIPPVLPALRKQWMQHRHSLFKLTLTLQPGLSKATLRKMFSNLEEMARLWNDKRYDYGEIEAWLILCDEFIAYRRVLKGPFHNEFVNQAVKAYRAAEELLMKRLDRPEFQSHMIGMAYFAWKLGIGTKTVIFWLKAANRRPIQLRHYAEWLRQQYYELQAALENNKSTAV